MELLTNPAKLKRQIIKILEERNRRVRFFPENKENSPSTSSVLFLMGICRDEGNRPETCLILNKRSLQVKQPGDLCCPGGSISPGIDRLTGKLLRLPLSPLARWPFWRKWKNDRPREADWIALLLATSLRESFEEMRLNPWAVKFLGPLPSHSLRMFKREIFPMTGWVTHQKRFFPNWEVEKIVRIPLRALLNRTAYARYRVFYSPQVRSKLKRESDDFPCFLYETGRETEMLWGVTYRIVAAFLSDVFQFHPPSIKSLPVVPGILDRNYLTGNNK